MEMDLRDRRDRAGFALRGGWQRVLGVGMLAAGMVTVLLSVGARNGAPVAAVAGNDVLHLADCRHSSAEATIWAIADPEPLAVECYSEGDGLISRLANWFTEDFIDGIGTSINVDGHGRTTASWSDGTNRLKVRIEGEVEFGDDDRTIERISRGGFVAIMEKKAGVKTELEVEPDGDGAFAYDYRVNDKRMEFDAGAQKWLGNVLVDIIRKTGIGAEKRANRILDKDGVPGLLDEVRLVPSDYVMRIFLGAALQRRDLTTGKCSSILEAAGELMDSDYEKAELLIEIADHRSWNSSLVGDYVEVAATMESDYETRRALSAIELDETVSQEVLDRLLVVASRMESDYEKSELLITLAPYCGQSQRLSEVYVQAVVDIDSDYEARRALSQLDFRGGMPPSALVTILSVAGRFGSDYEKAELLIEMAPYCHESDRAVDAYMNAASTLDSDYETGRVLSAFTDSEELGEYAALAVIDVVGQMSSSYEQSGALRGLAPHCRGNNRLEEAYLDAVDAVDSDYERDNLFSEFYREGREARRRSGSY